MLRTQSSIEFEPLPFRSSMLFFSTALQPYRSRSSRIMLTVFRVDSVSMLSAEAVQVEGFEVNDWLKMKIEESADEISKEKDCVGHLIPGTEFAACNITEDTMLPGEN